MQLRVVGLADELEPLLAQIRRSLDVISESEPQPRRGRDRRVQVYLEVRLRKEEGAPSP
jgi:hypothetical protein